MVVKITKNEVLVRLRTLKPELAARYGVSQIGIFGSVARNEDHQTSDIDVVVHMPPDMLNSISGFHEPLPKRTNRAGCHLYLSSLFY